MEQAGAALAREAHALQPSGIVLVACGPGNNGGDGYVCARHLAALGREVLVWAVVEPKSRLCMENASRLSASVKRLAQLPSEAPALIVDAILGTGRQGRPREPIAGALRSLRAQSVPIISADLPSGIGSDLVLPATLTVCFQAAKVEMLALPHLPVKVVDIGLDARAYQEVQQCCLRRFPPLKRTGHKGSHGELLVVGGGVFPGALELACRAAVMTGCDLVRAWTAEGPKIPSTIVVHRQRGPTLTTADPEQLTPLLVRASAVLIGPGLGREDGGPEAAQQVFSLALDVGVPLIIDADAIAALAEPLRNLPKGDANILITPHRGEARNLIASAVDEEKLHAFARPDRVLLAKATVDLITDGRRWQRNNRGNPRMAVGGTGDLLAGLAAGLIARGAPIFDAARMAVLWLTSAADELWLEQGPCYDAETVIGRLPATLKRLMEPLGNWPPMTG
jgi:ADP-dependent NAD(P)H-hydrate dehydratase / NAD(P)H-hydrate epimerase